MVPRSLPCALFALAVLASGCGENRRDVFMAGLEIEGAAERGPCKLQPAAGPGVPQGASALSGDTIADCLQQTEAALAKYKRAAELGLSDPDFVSTYDRAKERKARLESMLKMVRQMENDQVLHPAK
ncbi:MAG: hypothetical protein K1X88_11625 [Nannocystaceae bacterium]|nr:hypothetical protein [Nannocystaceae bacterium]